MVEVLATLIVLALMAYPSSTFSWAHWRGVFQGFLSGSPSRWRSRLCSGLGCAYTNKGRGDPQYPVLPLTGEDGLKGEEHAPMGISPARL